MELSPNSAFLQTETIGKCWIECVQKVLHHGILQHDENVEILEILGLSIEILKPQCNDEIITAHGDKSVIERTLAKFSKGVSMPNRPFTYGARIFEHSGIDQFEWLVDRLLSKRETKSATIGLLIPGCKSSNPPCLTTVDAKIRGERLELQFFFRSQNIFGRQYANLLALAKLQADIAERCSVTVGSMRGYIASAHIYTFDITESNDLISGDALVIEDKYYVNGPKSIRQTKST